MSGMDRLSDALALWLQHRAATGAPNADDLLAAHPELRDLLEPLLADDTQGAALDAAERDGAARGPAGSAGPAAIGPGTVLGDFELLRELGRGGMGVVFAARQRTLDRLVAVKLLPPGASLQPQTLARFRREAATTARFDHPGIVAVHAVGEHGGLHWFAMELVDGETLDRHAARQRTADPTGWTRRAVELAAAVADALQFAHERGVVHRDVKPTNVLVRADGTAVVTDFGLARSAGLPALSQHGEFAGTPNYVSPEQARGDGDVDARSDVFSLGVTLYELLTARLPFAGDTTRAVLERIQRAEPPRPSRLDRDLPRDLDSIVMKALAKEPRHRYATAAELAADLRRFLAHRPVLARPIRAPRRLWRWARREPLQAGLAAALLAAGLLGAYAVVTRAALEVGREELLAERIDALLLDATIAPLVAGADRDALVAEARRLGADDPYTLVVTARTGDRDAAVRRLQEYLEVHGRSPAVERARTWLAGGDTAALPEPADALDHFAAGEAALERWARGERDAAAAALRHMLRAVALADRPRSQFFIGLVRAGRAHGDMDAVRTAADALVEHWPQSAAAACHRAMAWEDEDDAVTRAEAERSLRLAPDNFIGLSVLGKLAEREGDDATAQRLQETARRLHPAAASFQASGPARHAESSK